MTVLSFVRDSVTEELEDGEKTRAQFFPSVVLMAAAVNVTRRVVTLPGSMAVGVVPAGWRLHFRSSEGQRTRWSITVKENNNVT